MRVLKYIALAAAAFAALACGKHMVDFNGDSATDKAMLQILYFEPINNISDNAMDSVYINDVRVSGTLYVYNQSPSSYRFFAVSPGAVNIKLFRGAEQDGSSRLVYERDVTLDAGRWQVVVYDLNEDPFILDDDYPYPNHSSGGDPATFNTDSLVSYRFLNVVYQSPGVPYQGKLQYQYMPKHDNTWHDLGEPVGFGEQTARVCVAVHKTVFNSSGSERVEFRCVDPETGQFVAKTSDYWNGYIGRAYTHILRGCLTGSPIAHYSQFSCL